VVVDCISLGAPQVEMCFGINNNIYLEVARRKQSREGRLGSIEPEDQQTPNTNRNAGSGH
jgi:hypothetical protein